MNIGYDLAVLNAAIAQRKRPPRFFRDRFFKTQMPEAVNIINVDTTKLGKRQLAPYVTPISNGVAVSKDGYKTLELKPAYLAPMIPVSVADFAKRIEGESPFSQNTPESRRAAKMAQYLNQLDDLIDMRIEYMAVEAIRTGATYIKGKDIDYKINYERSDENSATLTTNKWGTAGAEIADNFRTWRRIIMKNSGVNPDTLVMGSKALSAFLKDEKIARLYSKAGYDMASLTGVPQDNLITYYGHIPEFGHIFTYDGIYFDEVTKTEKALIPESEVIYASSVADNRLYFGAINNEFAGGVVALERFVSYHPYNNGKGGELTIESAPLPANTDPDSVFVAKVL